MKRYELSSKEEILKAFDSTLICSNCILNPKCDEATSDYHVPCNKRITKYFYEEIVPKTKADHIRTMTDEQLATFLCDLSNCGHCIASDLCWNNHNGFDYLLKQVLPE